MGRFVYETAGGGAHPVEDSLLAHLELAIAAKFRRDESFAFTLGPAELPAGEGRRTFWMHPSLPIQFVYDRGRDAAALNRAWVEALVVAASTEAGLRVVPEPTPDQDPSPKPLLG